MKNKRILRKWVVYAIIIINFINLFIASGEWTSLLMQLLFSIYTVIVLSLSYKLIRKYGRGVLNVN